jgi:TolB-like protein
MTGDPAKEYFSDGMAEELIHTLARLPGLRVPSRTSSFAYKGRNVDLRQIASDLRVGAVLEGSVRSAGERIRITAQLIDAESGYHLWSQSYDRRFDDLFELQDDLTREIVRTLRASFTTDLSSTLAHTPPTHDLEAYHLYLQAVAMFSATQFGRATELVQQALARDPQFARALALRASLRAQAFALDLVLPGTLADAQREIGQAMALAPDDHTPYSALGVLCTAQGKWIEAEEAFRNAHARNTTHDPTVLSAAATYLTQSVGGIERSLSQFLELHRLAPAWLVNLLSVAAAYHFLGRHGEAHRFMDLAIQLGMSKTVLFVPDVLAMVAMHDGRHEEAADLMVNALTPMLRDAGGVEAVQSAFTALARRDGYRTAIEKLNRLRARVRLEELTLLGKRRFVLWYTLLGAPTEAFDVANETLDALGRHGTIGTAWGFMWMREMLPFRQDARFQTLCERLKLFDYWKKFGPPDNCELRDGKLICN